MTSYFLSWDLKCTLQLQGFITDNERALEDLFGDEESSRKGDACLNAMAARIATVFASLRVFYTSLLDVTQHNRECSIGITIELSCDRSFQPCATVLPNPSILQRWRLFVI